MKTQFEQMMDGLNDVEAFLAGEQEGFKAHVPQEVDVKAIRNRLGMTQARFSDTFGFSLDAIKHWEGGRRTSRSTSSHFAHRHRQKSRCRAYCAESCCVCCHCRLFKPTTIHVKGDRKRQTPDKPTVTLSVPDPNHINSFMNFRVADIQACYELWKSRGAEFITKPIPKYGEIRCYIRDPDGYIIEVGQSTDLTYG
jgi:DNA-binding transcriptional regulator YiaG